MLTQNPKACTLQPMACTPSPKSYAIHPTTPYIGCYKTWALNPGQ